MCGIFCIFANNCDIEEKLLQKYEACKTQLDRRGPDFQCIKTVAIADHSFAFAASVLWLQGPNVIKQPIETDTSIFIYNGNLYEPPGLNDTELLLDLLDSSEDLLTALGKIQGPYAFIYLNKRTLKLYFCRDPYGRRSLLIGTNKSELLLTSVASKSMGFQCLELPALGVFCYDLHSKALTLVPWAFKHQNFESKCKELEVFLDKTLHISERNQNGYYKQPFIAPTQLDLLHFTQVKTLGFEGILNEFWLEKVSTLQDLLGCAVSRRVLQQPDFCVNCIRKREICLHALTGVLFSGGVDCTILALLADDYTDKHRPIDLLNVAFNDSAPDRATGLESLDELKRLRPDRSWNFVEINVSSNELEVERTRYIADLIYPRNTILDDSLGCALWFASRGQCGSYRSPCRVLLVGMGADELFGGYTKHRAALKQGGWSALHRSLEDDWQNISHRNLARDDRVVSDHGRQLCTPYLDENVVRFVRSLHCWEKTFPSEELQQGLGEKILLRSLAHRIGLKNAAGFKKRALQFGSRIANRKENANDVSPRL